MPASLRPGRTHAGRSKLARAPAPSERPLGRALAERLRLRIRELEAAIRNHLLLVAAGPKGEGRQCQEALVAAVPETLFFAIASIEQGEGEPPPIPGSVTAQARRASGVAGLGMIVRCFTAGERLFAQLVAEQAREFGDGVVALAEQRLSEAGDRLLDAVSEAYVGELEKLRRSPSQRLSERVHELLSGGGPDDGDDLGYPFDRWHVGLVVHGPDARVLITQLARDMDLQALVAAAGDGAVWAWLGGRTEPQVSRLEALIATAPPGARFAIGEAREGFVGWRLTHREAETAAAVMRLRADPVVRGKEVLLLAAALKDEMLATSLRETFLLPFSGEGEEGAALRQTLRAYLESGGNAVAAAASLGVNRHTVQRRLRRIEADLGDSLHRWHAELKVALDLEDVREG